MRLFILRLILLVSITPVAFGQNANKDLKLWYDKPAKHWVEALPLGNGRLGAMVFGDPQHERLQINENTVWAGSPYRNDNAETWDNLSKIRQLIFEEKFGEAEKLAQQKITSKGAHGMPYQTVGDVHLEFTGQENYTDYYRELDLTRALVTSRYKVNGVAYKREVFSSFNDQVIVMRISADKPGNISFSLGADRPGGNVVVDAKGNTLTMSGTTSNHEGIPGKVKFCATIKVLTQGGVLATNSHSINVSKSQSAVLFISVGTNFKNYHDISNDALAKANFYINKAQKKLFSELLLQHVKDYQKMFNRVQINLGSSNISNVPTDQRIKDFSKTNDPSLASLYFQFGRYLLICSSQPGGQPANLQGLWTDQLFPAWDSKYTVNINTEMNYWPSEITNLSETSEPLVQMLRELSVTGQETAKSMYHARGWVLHHNTDLWRFNGAIDGAPGLWPTGAAWLCQQLWKKFEFNGDIQYLKSVYPIMKGASIFFKDFLVEEPVHKWLVVTPSISPENAPYKVRKAWICIAAGTTLDNLLVHDLFTKTIKSAELLKTDPDFIDSLQVMIKRLPPMQIGKYGQLQEWLEDWDNPEDHHRHVSHLYGVYPGNQISPYRTPELFNAARTSLIYRGDASTGWSMGWKMNLWARFQDGNHAYKLLTHQLSLIDPNKQNTKEYSENGGTYPNLFDVCPPFQIDGNLGCTAGIAEMLLQSHDGFIHPLPALPDVWENGNVSGLKTVGGFEISMEWKNAQLSKLIVKSNLGGNCQIRLKNEMYSKSGPKLELAKGENKNSFFSIPVIQKPIIHDQKVSDNLNISQSELYEFKTQQGGVYTFYSK